MTAPATDPSAAPPHQPGLDEGVLGRAAEQALVGSFLETAGRVGAVLLLFGDPGMGKSTLLDAAARSAAAAGARVLRAAGSQVEANLSFSALDLLLSPVQDRLAELLPEHRDALLVAFGQAGGPPPDRQLVAESVVALLQTCARTAPLLLVVDDLQWLDRATASVLGVVARRVHGARLGLLGAQRSGEDCFFDRSGLPQHELAPLDEGAATALVERARPGIAAAVLRRVVQTGAGNPLALLELPVALSREQLAGAAPLPPVLPLGARLDALFSARIAELPGGVRELLLLAALETTGSLEVLRAAHPGELAGDLAAAEQARLLVVDRTAGAVAFRHAAVRSATVGLSTSGEQQQAHHRLAGAAVDVERQAWHRAAAAHGPDEQVAALLEQVAHQLLDRGDAAGAVSALLRCAALTPDARRRRERLGRAAYFGVAMAGELRPAADLMAEIRRDGPGGGESLTIAMAAALLLVNDPDGDVPTAHAVLARTLEAGGDHLDAGDGELVEALHQLLQLCQMGEDRVQWDVLRALLARVQPAVPEPLRLMAAASQPLLATDGELHGFGELVQAVRVDSDPVFVARLTAAAFSVDQVEDCCPPMRHFVAEAFEQQGAARAQALPALMSLSWQAFLTGRWEECAQTSTDGLGIARQLGYASAFWPFRLAEAALAAARGDTAVLDHLTDEVIGWAAPRQCGSALELCRFVRSLAAVGRRDYEAAYRECTTTSAPGVIPPHARRSGWFALDLVESALRTGRAEAAAAHAEALTRAGVARLSPRAAMAVLAARAMTAPDDVAGGLFEQAVATPGVELWPFERARVQLLHGEHLRRRRAAMDARTQLTQAHATFVRLRATPWTERAAAELRASGTQLVPAKGPALGLTPQEHEVAVLAAAGLTNRQIAARLDISHRTVGMHLYRVFPKLDVATRAGLSDALAGQ